MNLTSTYKIQIFAHLFAVVFAVLIFFLKASDTSHPPAERYYFLLFIIVLAPISSIFMLWVVQLGQRMMDFAPKEDPVMKAITFFYSKIFLSAVLFLPSVGIAIGCLIFLVWLLFKL